MISASILTENILKILDSNELDKKQKIFFENYKNCEFFIKILANKNYNEIPATIDFFILAEQEIINEKQQVINKILNNPKAKLTRDSKALLQISSDSAEKLGFSLKNYKSIKDEDKIIIADKSLNIWKASFLPSEMSKFFENKLKKQEEKVKEAYKIKNCFKEENEWSKKLLITTKQPLTNPDDLKNIENLCNTLAKTPKESDEIFVAFFENLVKAKENIKGNKVDGELSVEDFLNRLPDNWYSEPWYYTYVQYFGANSKGKADFGSFKKMLTYLEKLGIKNIYILPHYQSPNGDAGYDISDYKPSGDYGGEKKFNEFIKEATKRGFRVATDLVFNHTSAEHIWFLKALSGESKYFDYYLKCPENWDNLDINKIIKDEDGDLFLYLPEKDEAGRDVISKRILIFPDVDKTLWLKKEVKKLDKEVLFYREFYPFQIDLDLQNPMVMEELFEFLGNEISHGVLGKRTDAIAHWIKKPGTNAKDLPATYALQMLIKQFLKHVNDKTIILPEVVTTSKKLKNYAGEKTYIKGKETTTGGDALLDFQLQGMLREMLYFEKTTPFWTQVFDRGEEGTNTSVPLLPIEHHDETYMGFIQELEPMREYIEGSYNYIDRESIEKKVKRGVIYKNGMSGGARYANCLNEDVRRVANAFFCLYMMPASPVIYYGTEIGAVNRWEQMKQRQIEQFNTLKCLLGEDIVGDDKPITFEKCEDPRELQRGILTEKEYKQALKEKYPAVEAIKALNSLRKEKSALRSFNFTPLDTWHESILGMVRYPETGEEKPIIVLSNLSGEELTAKIPTKQVRQKLGENCNKFRQIFSQAGETPHDSKIITKEANFPVIRGELILIRLKPYSSLLLECIF